MPRGAKLGERRGGRVKGRLNKATIKRSIVAEWIMQEVAMSGRKLRKEMIEDFAVMFGGLAAAVQPVGTGPAGQVTRPDLDKWLGSKHETAFKRYSKLALKAATELADFQSPRFAPISAPSPQLTLPIAMSSAATVEQ
jgi:hypothetical protein